MTDRPSAAELRRLYVTEDRSMPELTARFRVGTPRLRGWLVEAGIPIRSKADGGRPRQLDPPPAKRLAALVDSGATVPQLATKLAVGQQTVRRWLDEADVSVPRATLKNRPRGAAAPLPRPSYAQLRACYVEQGLSLETTAQQLDATRHLVRTWLLEDGIPLRRAGGRAGAARPSRPLKPVPPEVELRRLREQERLPLPAIAARYRVHPQTVAGWLRRYGLPSRLPPAGPVSNDYLVAMYVGEHISATEIARRVGASPNRVLDALHTAGVSIDRTRQADAARAAAHQRRDTVPSLTDEQATHAVALFAEGWSYSAIARELDSSTARVRRELRRRGLPSRPRPLTGPASRGSRTQAPVDRVRELYVESEWSAEDVGARVDLPGWIVLRTAHAHGVPVRQGGRPVVSATVALIEALYRDSAISEIVDRHHLPRRPAGGDIATRFPDPIPLSAALLRDLYAEAGCSSVHIELLTGHPQAVVRPALLRHGIPRRPGHMSPALARMRAEAREEFLAGVMTDYRKLGSTRLVAQARGCAPGTVLRWLHIAGVAVPGRGQWRRPQHSVG